MVDFVEPIEPGWVSLSAASSLRGVGRSTLHRWATELGLISFKMLPKHGRHVGAKARNGHELSRILLCADEVKTAIGPVKGHQKGQNGRPKRPEGDPLSKAEMDREAKIKALYQDAIPGCIFRRIQTPSGYYMLEIWSDESKTKMIVSHPLSPAKRADCQEVELIAAPIIEPDWISLKEAADLREVSVNSIFRWATHQALISHCRLPVDSTDDQNTPILVRRSEIERLVPPPRGNPNKTGSRGNRPEGDPLTPNERQRLKEIEETYRKAKPDCVVDLRQYGSGYYAAEIFENPTRKKMVVTLPLAPGEFVDS
jgi:hypothetical protein